MKLLKLQNCKVDLHELHTKWSRKQLTRKVQLETRLSVIKLPYQLSTL